MSQYSIQIRLRRIITEDAYISVPITDEVIKSTPEEDGTYRIDFEALQKKAIQLSENALIEWKVEEKECQVHPIQQPLPDSRSSFIP